MPLSKIDLLRYLHLPTPNLNKHKGEKKIHLEIIQRLVPLTIDRSLNAMWFHVPNEAISSPSHGIAYNIQLKMMGKLPGVPDLVFMWNSAGADDSAGVGFVEIKSSTGKRTENQETFKAWCDEYKIPNVIVRSWPDLESTLKGWGVL